MFSDRRQAGQLLADEVAARSGPPWDVVLALPRGGVPVGWEVAARLGAALDVLVVRKIGAPWQPEYGVGAVADSGDPLLDEDALRELGLAPMALAPQVEAERAEARRRLGEYRGDRAPVAVARRAVLIVDDGLATGNTARLALRLVRASGPTRLGFAAPVVAAERAAALAAEGTADDVIAVEWARDLRAVGQFYDDFTQTTDDEVRTLLGTPPGVVGSG
jgi:putative phosphoribosyl transferase